MLRWACTSGSAIQPVVVRVNERGVESSAQEDASWRRAMCDAEGGNGRDY